MQGSMFGISLPFGASLLLLDPRGETKDSCCILSDLGSSTLRRPKPF